MFKKNGFVLAPAKPRQPRGSGGAPPRPDQACTLARSSSHCVFVRVVCAAAKGPTGIQKKAPRGRPFAAKCASSAENASPQRGPSAGVARGVAEPRAAMVATVEKVYAQDEPVSPQALLARFAFVPAI